MVNFCVRAVEIGLYYNVTREVLNRVKENSSDIDKRLVHVVLEGVTTTTTTTITIYLYPPEKSITFNIKIINKYMGTGYL